MKNIIKLFSLGVAAFIVPVIIILMIVNIVTGGYKIPENSLTDDLVKERLSPLNQKQYQLSPNLLKVKFWSRVGRKYTKLYVNLVIQLD